MPSRLSLSRRAAWAAALVLMWLAGPSRAADVVLTGHVRKSIGAGAAMELRHAAADENVDLALVVRLDQDLMTKTLARIYSAPVGRRHYLTPDEFARAFGLAEKRQKLKDFAAANGLVLSADDSPDSLVVKVSGRSGDVERAFHVRLNHYRLSDGREFRGNDSDPAIPSSLAPHFGAVLGLENLRGAAKPHFVRHKPRAAAAAPAGAGASPRACGDTYFCGTGVFAGIAPSDIKTVYGVSSLAQTGSGQTVALMELDGYTQSDITAYQSTFSFSGATPTYIPVDFQANDCGVNQNLACNATTLASDGGMVEVALDIDMVMAMAPGAAIDVYGAPNTSQGILDAYSKIANDDAAKSVSTSWGGSEDFQYGGALPTLMTSENAVFSQMAAQGQTMFAAAGDNGAYDDGGATTLATDDPASQPYVTAVGGTSLLGSPSNVTSEVVWNNGYCTDAEYQNYLCNVDDGYSAGAGGIAKFVGGASTYWPMPTYQAGINSTTNGSDPQTSQTYRNLPDVSLNADPVNSPYQVCVGGTCTQCDSNSCDTLIGGTSAAAPLWAAYASLINQKLAGNGTTLGFANPVFYAIGLTSNYNNLFHDITATEAPLNGVSGNGAYSATSGYDNASGLGTILGKGAAMFNFITAPPASGVTGLSGATLGASSITWTWSSVLGADYYDLYYPGVTLLASTPTLTYTQVGLAPNTAVQVVIKPADLGGVGATGVTSPVAATDASPVSGTPSVVSSGTSLTVTYATCGAACSGYELDADVNSNFSGTISSVSTLNPAVGSLAVTGLAAATAYYLRLGARNSLGATNYISLGQYSTTLNLVAPTLPSFSEETTGTIEFNWNIGANPANQSYLALASTASFHGVLNGTTLQITVPGGSATSLDAVFNGLSADTTYYFEAQAVGGPLMSVSTEATLALPPAVSTTPFLNVTNNAFTVAWSSGGDQPDTLYQADVSLSPSFSPVAATTQVRTTAASFGGLTSNTVYYARALAVSRSGRTSAETALGSTSTAVAEPVGPFAFSAQGTNGFAFSFGSAGNPAGTRFLVQVSHDPAFSVVDASSNTASATATFGGLLSNQLYYAEVAGLNQFGAPTVFAAGGSTSTAVEAPLAAAVPVTNISSSTLGFAWTAGSLSTTTLYNAQVSLSPSFTSPVSSVTANPNALFALLAPNATYYGRVQALSQNAPNPAGPYLSLGAFSATLAAPPGLAAQTFAMVGFTSATVQWAAPGAGGQEGYLVELSPAPGFTSGVVSSATAGTSAALTGLLISTTYYGRVAALNWEGLADFTALGSTVTGLPPLSSGTVTSAGATFSVPPAYPQLTNISVSVPAGAFPVGTPVSVIANIAMSLAGARTHEASSIVPFGPTVGIELDAAGLQPSAPVVIALGYDPATIPAGQKESSLQMWRYDIPSGDWTVVPSQTNTKTHVLTAYAQHFSTFAPFFTTAGTDFSAVAVFPQPWVTSDPGSQYWATDLTVSGLPAGTEVRFFTVNGEEIFDGTANGGGTLTWNGMTRFGKKAASGTYYAAFQNGGQRKVRRVVIVR